MYWNVVLERIYHLAYIGLHASLGNMVFCDVLIALLLGNIKDLSSADVQLIYCTRSSHVLVIDQWSILI